MPSLTSTFETPDNGVDLLVVGLGPAGMACALQAVRDGLDVLAVGNEPVGGLVRAARRLDNLPATPGVSGVELAEKLAGHLQQVGVPTAIAQVSGLARCRRGFVASTANGHKIFARTVCLALGTRPKTWDHSGHSLAVHRDARSLPASLEGSEVVVIGGGEAALDTALTCRDRGGKVTALVRGDRLRAASGLVKEVEESQVNVRLGVSVEKLAGVPGDWLIQTIGGEVYRSHVLVVCIGRMPRDELLHEVLSRDYQPQVIQPDVPGLMLAGDLIRGRDRYVATAMGDGQRAALAAGAFLKEETWSFQRDHHPWK